MTVQFDRIEQDFSTTGRPVSAVMVPVRGGIYRNYCKRFLDTVVILASAPFVIPVVLILAFLVARDGHNPFFWNKRVGKNGKSFGMLKLRTMVPDAEMKLEQYLSDNPDARDEWAATQKLKVDPRITRFGRFLRKVSLDELPQLWNVLVGDMSLIGPRPMMPSQRALYPGLAYYALRPGISGLWQVSDRNDSEFAKRADFDREYDENLSLGCDLRLLVKTFSVVLKGTGY